MDWISLSGSYSEFSHFLNLFSILVAQYKINKKKGPFQKNSDFDTH